MLVAPCAGDCGAACQQVLLLQSVVEEVGVVADRLECEPEAEVARQVEFARGEEIAPGVGRQEVVAGQGVSVRSRLSPMAMK